MIDLTSARTFVTTGAASNGLRLTPEAIEAATAQLAASTRRDAETGAFQVLDGEHPAFHIVGGRAEDVPIQDHVMAIVRQHAASAMPAAPSQPNGFTGQTAAAAALVERIRRQDQADALANAEAIASGPNPWEAGSLNLTRQAILRKYLPHVAAQLKARAGR